LLSDTDVGGAQVVPPGSGIHAKLVAPTNVEAFWISTGDVKSAICDVVVKVADPEQGN
jgi:hypothetical protein